MVQAENYPELDENWTDDDYIEDLLDNDEISSEEAAFLHGYATA